MAPHSSTLAWKIPWMEEPGRLRSMGSLRERLHFHFSLSCIGEGNSNPLQCSCLENPRDGGAWWAAIYGVAQSSTWLKRLSSRRRRRRQRCRRCHTRVDTLQDLEPASLSFKFTSQEKLLSKCPSLLMPYPWHFYIKNLNQELPDV